jgi:hypothetical protein
MRGYVADMPLILTTHELSDAFPFPKRAVSSPVAS